MSHKDDVIRVHKEHPDWTARQIAESLGIARHHVYNTAYAEKLALAAAPPVVYTPMLPAPIEAPPPAAGDDFVIYANDPAGMVAAQSSMIRWCDEKIVSESHEQEQAQRNRDTAHANDWAWEDWDRAAKLFGQKIDFYEKVKAALQAGYYIVPPFPVDVFAIRTTVMKPHRRWTKEHWRAHQNQKAQLLPAGEGRYVDPAPVVSTKRFDEVDAKGITNPVRHWRPDEFTDVEFPFKLAKAEILSATRAAMAMKVFDAMGALPQTRHADPIICGQILMPHRNRQPLTFFVTWWLDTRTL